MIDLNKIRKDFYKQCTSKGIHSYLGLVGFLLNKMGMIYVIILIICAIIFSFVIQKNLFQIMSEEFGGFFFHCICIVFLTSIIATFIYIKLNCLAIMEMKKQFKEEMQFINLKYKAYTKWYHHLTMIYSRENEYFSLKQGIINYHRQKFIREYKLYDIEMLNALIELNTRDIKNLELKTENNSTKALWAFIGGIIVNKFFENLNYDIFDDTLLELMDSLVLTFIFVVFVVIICKSYDLIKNFCNEDYIVEKKNLEKLNEFLINQKLELLYRTDEKTNN